MVTIRYNWHQYSERQTIYNIYIINSSNEIMSLLEFRLFSLWGYGTYTPLPLLFSSFFFFPLGCLILVLGTIAGEASKNSIRVAGIWRKSLFHRQHRHKNSYLQSMRKSHNVLYHRIRAMIAILLNKPLSGNRQGVQQQFLQSIKWKQVVVGSNSPLYETRLQQRNSNPYSPLDGSRLQQMAAIYYMNPGCS